MGQPILRGHGLNRLAQALASSGSVDMDTAGTLLNMDYLRSKMAGDAITNTYHQAEARKAGAEADLKGQQLDSYKRAPESLLLNAAAQSDSSVPEVNAYMESLRNPASAYTPAEGGMGPPAPANDFARTWDGNRKAQLSRGIGEYLRAMGSTKPNGADDLARAAEEGAKAQQIGMGTDAAMGGDTQLIQNLRELTHNPAPESSEKGQLGVIHGLMSDLNMDPQGPEGQKLVKAYLAKLTTHPDTQNRLQQLQQQAMISFPGNDEASSKRRNDEIWRGLVAELDPIKALIKNALTPPGGPAAGPASPAATTAAPGEVPATQSSSGKISKPSPSQKDRDYVKAHPEKRKRFIETFGVEP